MSTQLKPDPQALPKVPVESPDMDQFLDAFLGNAGVRCDSVPPAQVVVVTLPDKKHKLFNVDDLQDIRRYAVQAMKTQNVYLTMTLQDMALNKGIGPKGEDKERSAEAASCVLALWVDIDVQSGGNAHKAKSLPTREEFDAFQSDLGLVPSMIVDSGNGYHLYLLLREPLYLYNDSDREWATKLIKDFQLWLRNEMTKAGKKSGSKKAWYLDGTADLARILRVAGTNNHKTNPPKSVQFHAFRPGLRYDVYALRNSLDLLLNAQTNPHADESSSAKGGQSAKTNTDSQSGTSAYDQLDSSAYADLITSECAWLQHCMQNAADLPEPEWYQLATLLVRCVDGDRLFQDYSKPYENYIREEAEEKLRHARLSPGPVTCEFIQRELGFEGCSSCAHKGLIKSPISLGVGNRLRAIFPDCPVDLIIPGPYVVTEEGIFTLESQD